MRWCLPSGLSLTCAMEAEIRSDALKLCVLRRPVPREAVDIGAWMEILQLMSYMSECSFRPPARLPARPPAASLAWS